MTSLSSNGFSPFSSLTPTSTIRDGSLSPEPEPIETNEFDGESPCGLAQLISQKVKLFGNKIAIENGSDVLTYAALHRKAQYLVRRIHAHNIRQEEAIGIMIPRGIDHVVAQVAIIYSGATCVPLDVDHPDSHLEKLLANVNSSLIMVDESTSHRMPNFQSIAVNHNLDKFEESNKVFVSEASAEACTHLLHTSGSTGLPKAVQVLAAGIINITNNAAFQPIGTGFGRIGHVSATTFDISLWEIYGALIQGATLVVFEKQILLDPPIYAQRLQKYPVDVMWQTTTLLATITHACPDTYRGLHTLLTGGEAINPQVIRTIMAHGPPRRIFNVYGPTECSCFATFHQVREEEVASGVIPIGRPFHNYSTYVLDDDQQPVPHGEVGELVIGGLGVARGYFNNPIKTEKTFVSAPHLDIQCRRGGGRFYRSGDLVRLNEAGLIEYVGRADYQVKVHGHRIELETIELLLVETTLVNAAMALKVELDESQGGSFLLAYVVPESEGTSAESIRDAFNVLAPGLMAPRLVFVSELALTSSGKTDRKELARQYKEQVENAQLRRSNHVTESKLDGTEFALQNIWLKLLGLPVHEFAQEDDFFALGATSLQAAGLVAKINSTMGVKLLMRTLYENPTLKQMAKAIENEKSGINSAPDDKNIFVQDCQLAEGLKPLSGNVPIWSSESEGRVFLTGATGFMGAFLLAELVARSDIQKVVCLVRAPHEAAAFARILAVLERYQITLELEQQSKISALAGDFAASDLGLGEQKYHELAEWASVVFHLGAHVDYVQPYQLHRAANVLGVLHILQFSVTGRSKGVHYTSSLSAYGPTGLATGATYVPEDQKPDEHLDALLHDTGYAQSQFVAESIVWSAIRNGLPVSIYRPGFVLGDSKRGTVNPIDFIGRVITTSLKMGRYPLLAGLREEFAPVDFVVPALVHIATSNLNYGHAYNLINPEQDGALDIVGTFELIRQSLKPSATLIGVTYRQWVECLSQQQAPTPLQPLMPFLEEQAIQGLTRWEAHRNSPRWGCQNLRQALAASPAPELLACPSLQELIPKYLGQWQQEIEY